MKTRILVLAAALALAATGALAQTTEYRDWVEGPAHFLMTKEEAAASKAVTTAEQAKAFVDLFWARRDPTPATPRNEAKELFEARVDWADKNVADGSKKRGALTDRGKTFVLYGQPKRIERSASQQTPGFANRSQDLSREARSTEDWTQWIYEGDETKAVFGVPRAVIRFVDRSGTNDYRVERGSVDLAASQQRAIQKLIVQPDLKTVPTFTAQAPAAPAVAAPAAPVKMTALSNAALATAVTEFKAAAKNPYQNLAFPIWGEYVTASGEYFVPVLLSVAKSTGLAADQDVTFFGVIEDDKGNAVLAFEEPAKLHAAKDDLFVDKSLSLPAGKHRAILGVAREGKPVAIASADMTLTGTLDKDAAAASPLLLSNFVQPMATAQVPTEPFAFGGVKVVPKADKTFKTSDELWYFFELRNPGLAEAIAPTEASATGAPAPQTPKVQVKIDVEGKKADGSVTKKSAPPREVDAIEMKGVPGHYGVGNAIPLESFTPGDYKITLKVIDTVKKQSYTLSDTFKVVQ